MPSRRDSFQSANYVPRKGDIVHLDWSPASGSEMLGPHYGLVVSEEMFNHASGMVYILPITSKVNKTGNLQLPISAGRVQGVALLSGLRSLDYQTRNIEFETTCNPVTVGEAARFLGLILGVPPRAA